MMNRPLPAGIAYPYDWGFLPSTRGEDGDPLDVLIMHEEPTVPGVVIRCKIAGALKVHETKPDGKRQRNDRYIAVPMDDCRARLSNVVELTKKLRTDLEEFFQATGGAAGKKLRFLGWAEPKVALELIREGEKAFGR
jgi:inorganic pyrophosphatase